MAKSMRVKTDDQVMITSGKDAGKTGRIVRTDPKKRRVYVEGLNLIKRHERPRSQGDLKNAQAGGIVEKEMPIHVSNLMVVCPHCAKPTRVGYRAAEDGKKVRFCKKCNETI
jgi:large subunit ribosomal protein L24